MRNLKVNKNYFQKEKFYVVIIFIYFNSETFPENKVLSALKVHTRCWNLFQFYQYFYHFIKYEKQLLIYHLQKTIKMQFFEYISILFFLTKNPILCIKNVLNLNN